MYFIAVRFSNIGVSSLMMAVRPKHVRVNRSEIYKSKTVYLLVLKRYVNLFAKLGMNSMKLYASFRECLFIE